MGRVFQLAGEVAGPAYTQGIPQGSGQKPMLEAAEIPARYREICQHLALARDRQYSAELIERLSRLALAGHQRLYGAHGRAATRVRDFILGGFPAAVRAQSPAYCSRACCSSGRCWWWAQRSNATQTSPMSSCLAKQIESFEQMYGTGAKSLGRKRDADDDAAMFGFYIWNNVRLASRLSRAGFCSVSVRSSICSTTVC